MSLPINLSVRLSTPVFVQLNPDVNVFQRKFVNEVRRCDDMERILNYMEAQIEAADIDIVDSGDNPEAPQPREMVDLEVNYEFLFIKIASSLLNGSYKCLCVATA